MVPTRFLTLSGCPAWESPRRLATPKSASRAPVNGSRALFRMGTLPPAGPAIRPVPHRIFAEVRRGTDGLLQILGLRPAGAHARLEGVVSVGNPADANGLGEPIGGDVPGRTEGIARSLQDQAGSAQRLEMFRSKPIGLARRVEGISQAQESPRSRLIGHEARDPAAKRLAAD